MTELHCLQAPILDKPCALQLTLNRSCCTPKSAGGLASLSKCYVKDPMMLWVSLARLLPSRVWNIMAGGQMKDRHWIQKAWFSLFLELFSLRQCHNNPWLLFLHFLPHCGFSHTFASAALIPDPSGCYFFEWMLQFSSCVFGLKFSSQLWLHWVVINGAESIIALKKQIWLQIFQTFHLWWNRAGHMQDAMECRRSRSSSKW